MKLRLGSMFAGIAGIDKGFELNNVDLVWANEVVISMHLKPMREISNMLCLLMMLEI